MPRIPGISSGQAIWALEKVGFRVIRQGKHVMMSNGKTRLTIPPHNPIERCEIVSDFVEGGES